MSFPLLVLLFALGILMGIATLIGVIPRGIELPLWVVIALVGAILIARSARLRFLTGFLGGLFAGLASPAVILLFFDGYLRNNPSASQAFASLPAGVPPRLFIAALAPIIAIVYGLCIGLLASLAGRLFHRTAPASG